MSGRYRRSKSASPFTNYLLPSFPNLFWGRKAAAHEATVAESTAASRRGSTLMAYTDANDCRKTSNITNTNTNSDVRRTSVQDGGDAAIVQSVRCSMASTSSSEVTSNTTLTTTPPPLSTSPSSTISTFPSSPPTISPISAHPIVFSGVSDDADNDDAGADDGVDLAKSPTQPVSWPHQRASLLSWSSSVAAGTAATATRASAPSATAERPRHLKRVLPSTLRCRRCSADLAFTTQIVSKCFTGRHGRAYLVSPPSKSVDHLFAPEVTPAAAAEAAAAASARQPQRRALTAVQALREQNNLVNVRVGRSESRNLVTGVHVVADISCASCHVRLGWKYLDATDTDQRYKIGKFILEVSRLATFHGWEDAEDEYRVDGHLWGALDGDGRHGRGGGRGSDVAVTDVARIARGLMARGQTLNVGRVVAPNEDGEDDDEDDEYGFGDSYARNYLGAASTANGAASAKRRASTNLDPTTIEFDSDDEDECDDIFAGVWDAQMVAKRRALKLAAKP